MKLSPLQLDLYFLTEVKVSVNTRFDPKSPLQFSDADLQIDTEIKKLSSEVCRWNVTLNLNFQPVADANSPYLFSTKIVGFFHVLEAYPEENRERLVQTNGPSVLYGIAREVIRDLTARGPYHAVMLPTASFYVQPTTSAQPDNADSNKPQLATKAKKKTNRKSA